MRKLAGHQSQLCTLGAGSRCPQPCCQSRSGRFQTPRRRKTALEHSHPRLQHQSTDTVWAPALTENCSTIELTAPFRRRALCTSLFRMPCRPCRCLLPHQVHVQDGLPGRLAGSTSLRAQLPRQHVSHLPRLHLKTQGRAVSFASNVEAKALRSAQQDSSPTQRLQERNRRL